MIAEAISGGGSAKRHLLLNQERANDFASDSGQEPSREVHRKMDLYLIHLPPFPLDDKAFEALLQHVPADVQARIKRFRLPDDALRSLVGRLSPIWYLRTHSLLPSNISPEFGTTAIGKPILLSPTSTPPLGYNISHDGAYVFLGVNRASPPDIGVDLMAYPKDPWEVQEALLDQLTTDERAIFSVPLSPTDRAQLVTRLWTFKEGYVKATGDGIGFGLDRMSVAMSNKAVVAHVRIDGEDVKSQGWNWAYGSYEDQESQPTKTYGWSAFWKGEEAAPEVQHISWENFVKVFV